MKKAKISVVIPIYNTALYLRECLDSILNQDFDDYEVVCVDDGSTDNSYDILLEYQNKYNNLKVIRQRNSGVSITRNTGIKACSGEFLAFLDSDDFVEENYLSCLYNKAIETQSDIVICNFYRFYENINVSKPVFYKMRNGIFNKHKILKALIPDNLIHSYLWNKLWKREIFEDHDIFPDIKFEDLAVMSSLIYKAKKICVIDKPLYYYRTRKTSIVRNINLQTQNDYMKAYGLIRLFLEQNNEYDSYKIQFMSLSVKVYIVMFVVNLILMKENPSARIFIQNLNSFSEFIKMCNSKDFSLSKADILSYEALSENLIYSCLNTKTPK